MADNNGENNSTSNSDNSHNSGEVDGLQGFITDQIKQQERESRETDNLDSQKRDDFITRALAESKRMNKEIEKSHAKREQLHSELGSDRMDDWRNEHASQVLTRQQQELVNQHHQ